MRILTGRFVYLLLLFAFCFEATRAQTTLSGHVTGAGNNPLSMVSVALLHDSSFIAGAVSGEGGHFTITAVFVPAKTYTLQLSLVGYRNFTKDFIYPDTGFFGHLVLAEKEHVLNEVTVTAKKPLVTRKADRYIVNVENSYLADGNSGLDVLQKSPGLWVSPNGSIRIRGRQAVTVMINDVVQRMSETELADYLRTLRSEDISKIEIIPNPPAEYEVSSSGGIVHIILRKARKQGLTGTPDINTG